MSSPAVRPGIVAQGEGLPSGSIGLGTMRLVRSQGAWTDPHARDRARAVLRRAVELGVTFLDTADVYGPEESERLIAEALHPYPPGLVIATKGGLVREGRLTLRPVGHPDHLRRACEASLRRLKLDCIPLYQLHSVDSSVPLQESLGALTTLRQEGKIERIGLCNVGPAQLAAARAIVPISSVQNRFNLVERESEPVLEACEAAGIAFIPWFPLAKGSVAGGRRAVAAVARARGVSSAQVGLAWLLRRSPVMLPIPGTSSVGHLADNVAAAELRLSPEEMASLDGYRLPSYEARVAGKAAARGALRTLRRGAAATRRAGR